MMHLDKKQLDFLKYISKVDKIYYKDLSDKQTKIANFLEDNNLIDVEYKTKLRITSQSEKPHYEKQYRLSASISETGKAYLSEKKYAAREKWIPYIITTVISILALMKSYGHGIDDLFISCMKLLERLLQ